MQGAANKPEDIISQWTKEDYQGVAPYEWLYSFRDNAFQMERLRGIMIADANGKKVKNAGTLWRKYLETQMAGRGQEIGQNVTSFSGQEQELLCGSYECYDDGIQIENAYGGTTVVCPHPIMPVRRLVNIDSGKARTEIAYKRGGGWRKEIFDKTTLYNARNITQLADFGISVTSESAKDLVRYLAYMEDANYESLPESKTVGRLGWVEDYGFAPYVDGLIYDAAGMYGDAFDAVHEHGEWKKWLRLALEVRAGASIPCRIALAASFASVLVPKLGALPFIVHLWGSVSGIGKSVALIFAASVWAYPEIGSYVKTTKSTNVGYEQMAAFCGNLPLCMDELQMIQGKKELDELIYILCEGVSKTRGDKAGGIRQVQRWRNTIITTGEQPITNANSKAGAVNRVIEVECTEKLFEDPREAYQTLVANYGMAGRKFVEALQADPDAMGVMQDIQKAFYERLQGYATDKQILSASILLAADAMADLLLFDDQRCLTIEDIKPYLVTQTQADTNRRAYEWLCDWIAANTGHFETNSYGDYAGECWGNVEQDGSCAYIIKGVFDRVMTDAGFSAASFLSWASKNRLIRRDRDGKHLSYRKRLKGISSPARCVVLTLPTEDGLVTEDGDLDVTEDEAAAAVFQQMEL